MTFMKKTILGHIVSCHGLQGAFKIKSYVQDPQSWGKFKELSCGETFFGQWTWVKKTSKPDFIFALTPLASTRDEALKWIGKEITIPSDCLPPLAANEWYWEDLQGLNVFDPQDVFLGSVLRVHNFGAGDILELSALPEAKEGFLISFSFVKSVNIETKKILVLLEKENLM